MNDLIVGFIAGAIWVLVGFMVCAMVVDRWACFRKWTGISFVFSAWLILLWPLVAAAYGLQWLITGRRVSGREPL